MADILLPDTPMNVAPTFRDPEPRTMDNKPRPRTCGGGDVSSSVAPKPFTERQQLPALTPHLQAAAPAIYAAAEHLLDAGEWHDDGTFVYYPPRAGDGGQDPDRCAIVALQRALRHARLGPTRPYCPPPPSASIRLRDRIADGLWKAGEFAGTCLALGVLAWMAVIAARWLQVEGLL